MNTTSSEPTAAALTEPLPTADTSLTHPTKPLPTADDSVASESASKKRLAAFLTSPYSLRGVREFGYLLSGGILSVLFLAVNILLCWVAFATGFLMVFLPLILIYVTRFQARVLRHHNMVWSKQPPVHPMYLSNYANKRWYRRLFDALADAQSWIDMLAVTLTVVTAGLGLVVLGVWTFLLLLCGGFGVFHRNLDIWGEDYLELQAEFTPEFINWLMASGRPFQALAVAVLMAVLLPWLVRLIGQLHFTVSDYLLSGRQLWMDQIKHNERLQAAQGAARKAQTQTLNGVERNIHDGPQQQLVRLGIDLGRARMQLTKDPEAADLLLHQSVQRTQEILDELRNIVRGIAPPILVDRGLHAAVAELAARNSVPTTVFDDDMPEELPELTEQTLYYIVSEALANITQHAQATKATVRLTHAHFKDQEAIQVLVTDDGKGGANPQAGSGLAGLKQRVAAIDGWFDVSSPVDGPTVVAAIVPMSF